MKAIETTATIDESGQLTLDESLEFIKPQRVRVIVLISEDDETDPDETPTEIVIEGIHQGLHETLTAQTIPLSEMWSGIDSRTYALYKITILCINVNTLFQAFVNHR